MHAAAKAWKPELRAIGPGGLDDGQDDVAWLAFELFTATRAGGQLLMANSYGGPQDYLLLPFLIRTYRDLFRNIGYQINSEETFAGSKNSVEIEVLITLFEKMNEQSSGTR